MTLRCPNCNVNISRGQLLVLLRLSSIACPNCQAELALDGKGRAMLVGATLASIPLAVVLSEVSDIDFAIPVTIVVGVAFGCVASAKVGKLKVVESGLYRKS